MSDVAEAVFAFLEAHDIPYRAVSHAPAYTMADCAAIDREMGALMVKNLFLTTRHVRHFTLCLVRPDVRFRTADISRQVGSARLCFASEEALQKKLRCRPGSASPMGLIFPEGRDVNLIVDSALKQAPVLAFHPCDNTRSLAMSGRDFFERFLPAAGIEPVWIEVHDFLEPDSRIHQMGKG